MGYFKDTVYLDSFSAFYAFFNDGTFNFRTASKIKTILLKQMHLKFKIKLKHTQLDCIYSQQKRKSNKSEVKNAVISLTLDSAFICITSLAS